MYTFLHKKKSTFYRSGFFQNGNKVNIFGSKSRTLRQQNIRKKIHQLVQHIMCEYFVLWYPITEQNVRTWRL